MKSTTRKPTAAECLLGFLALATIVMALVAVLVRAVWVAMEDLVGEPHAWSVLDSFLGIWGAFVLLMAAVVLIGGGGILVGYLIAMALHWIAWAVTDGAVARPGAGETVADEAGEEDDDWLDSEERG